MVKILKGANSRIDTAFPCIQPALIFASGYKPTDSWRTAEAGKIEGYSSASAQNTVAADGSTFTFNMGVRSGTPAFGGYYGLRFYAAGMETLVAGADTIAGVRIDSRKAIKFNLMMNPEMVTAKKTELRVWLYLGHYEQLQRGAGEVHDTGVCDARAGRTGAKCRSCPATAPIPTTTRCKSTPTSRAPTSSPDKPCGCPNRPRGAPTSARTTAPASMPRCSGRRGGATSALTYFHSGYKETGTENALFTGVENAYKSKLIDPVFDSKGILQSARYTYPIGGAGANNFVDGGLGFNTNQSYFERRSQTREIAWNAKWTINERWSVQNDLQWVHATNNSESENMTLATFVPRMKVYPQDVAWGLPTWQEAAGQLDFGFDYRFGDHVQVSFSASNILDTVIRQTQQQGIGNMTRSWFEPGRSYRLALRYTY